MALIGQDKVVPIPTATRHGCHFFRFLGGGGILGCVSTQRGWIQSTGEQQTANWPKRKHAFPTSSSLPPVLQHCLLSHHNPVTVLFVKEICKSKHYFVAKNYMLSKYFPEINYMIMHGPWMFSSFFSQLRQCICEIHEVRQIIHNT